MTFTLHYTIQHGLNRYKLSCPLESPLGSPTEKECLTAILEDCGIDGDDAAECIKEYNAEVGCMMPDDRAIVGYTLAPPEMSQEVARELLEACKAALAFIDKHKAALIGNECTAAEFETAIKPSVAAIRKADPSFTR